MKTVMGLLRAFQRDVLLKERRRLERRISEINVIMIDLEQSARPNEKEKDDDAEDST